MWSDCGTTFGSASLTRSGSSWSRDREPKPSLGALLAILELSETARTEGGSVAQRDLPSGAFVLSRGRPGMNRIQARDNQSRRPRGRATNLTGQSWRRHESRARRASPLAAHLSRVARRGQSNCVRDPSQASRWTMRYEHPPRSCLVPSLAREARKADRASRHLQGDRRAPDFAGFAQRLDLCTETCDRNNQYAEVNRNKGKGKEPLCDTKFRIPITPTLDFVTLQSCPLVRERFDFEVVAFDRVYNRELRAVEIPIAPKLEPPGRRNDDSRHGERNARPIVP